MPMVSELEPQEAVYDGRANNTSRMKLSKMFQMTLIRATLIQLLKCFDL